MTAQFVVETQDGWWKLPIEGMAVTRCFFEAGVEFGMLAYSEDREHSTEISLGDEIHVEGGGRARLLSTDDPEGIHWLTGVVGKTIGVRVSPTSRLEIAFTDGARLAVDRKMKVEAWQILGPGGLNVFAGTGRAEPAIADDSSAVQRLTP